jgi:uncharacterized protein YndB with AHSA1/START domain
MKWLMYFVAGVVALLVLAVVVLLVLGRGDSRLAASVEIARPADVVFEWVTEPERVRAWVGWLVEIRPVTPQQAQVGARQVWVMEDRNNNNQLMNIESEIVAYQPPRAVSAQVSAIEGFTGTVEYAIEPLGPDRARLQYTAAYQFHHWLATLLKPVITRAAQQKLEEDLARLKQKAEADVAGIAQGQ